jgi:hypothetical protein
MWLLFAAAALLFAADPSWQTKPPAQWDDADAKQLLADSPWVVSAKLQPIPPRSPSARRESGDWDAGVGHGVGIAGTGLFGKERAHFAIVRAHAQPDPGSVTILWASAAPVRAAEMKLGATDVPNWGEDYYALAVLDVPAEHRLNAGHLKGLAALKRSGGGKDFKPARVEIVEQSDGFATVVYLFPRSFEITKKDSSITFTAQIGELVIAHSFFPEKMQIEGQLEL